MTFLRVMGFSLFILLSYTLFANILPQLQSDPPTEDTIPKGTLDMAAMIALGEKLFNGKGTCKLCHNDLGRAPNLLQLDLASIWPARLKDPRYNGIAKGRTGAKAVEEYIRESMVDPSAYVVAGFGKKGTGDKVSPMPKVDATPIKLKLVEMNALIAFLQDKAALIPTVDLPTADDKAAPAKAKTENPDEGGGDQPAATAIAAIEKFTCSACHDLEGSGGEIGPKLKGIGKRMTRAQIRESILNPNAQIAKGFKPDLMPKDYATQMRVVELNLIIEYLLKLPEQGQ